MEQRRAIFFWAILAFEIRSSALPDLLKARYVLILRYSIVRLFAEVAFDGATKGDLLLGDLAFEIRSSALSDLLKARYILILRYWIVRLFLWSQMIIKNTQGVIHSLVLLEEVIWSC